MSDLKGVIYGGKKLEICDQNGRNMITDEFSITRSYEVGDYCIYNNALNVFTAAKEAGSWNPEVVQSTTVLNELSKLNKRLGGLSLQMKTQSEFDNNPPEDKHTITFIDPEEE